MRIGLAQINCTVGDLDGNTSKILLCIDKAQDLQVDVVCFPELAITGYPPEDLLLKSDFISGNLEKLSQIVQHTKSTVAIVGFVDSSDDIYNAAAIAHDGKLDGVYRKMFLPNYGVFDENRYFQVGTEYPIFVINGINVGVTICEDIWYPHGPSSQLARNGAQVIININSSPYHMGKSIYKDKMHSTRAADDAIILVCVNLVGAQDELVFDGGSTVFDASGGVITHGQLFEEDFIVVDLDIDSIFRRRLNVPRRRKSRKISKVPDIVSPMIIISNNNPTEIKLTIPPRTQTELDPLEEVYSALVLGTRDYMHKNRFSKVAIGLSGGIDSSLVAAIAVDALGSENVIGVSMPSRYSSDGSKTDAKALANNLGIKLDIIPMDDVFKTFLDALSPTFTGTKPGLAEENLQARIRGTILMSISNKFGWLVLSTGNKSEIACGYCTLYGDMVGGFSVLKDVPKTLVYKLSRYRNSITSQEIIPQSVIDKPPSAELRPEQLDSDSLPDYEILDAILEAYVEGDKSADQIADMGYERDLVEKIISLVNNYEYKRRQSPPGVKITPKAFGRDRRLPITNRFKKS